MRRRPSRHRVVGQRVCACGCGQSFDVTTKYRGQLYKNKRHIPARIREESRKRGALRARLRRFGGKFRFVLPDDVFLKYGQRLLDVGAEIYKEGYVAGYRTGSFPSRQSGAA